MGAKGYTDQECIYNANQAKKLDLAIKAINHLFKMAKTNRRSIEALTEMCDLLRQENVLLKERIK